VFCGEGGGKGGDSKLTLSQRRKFIAWPVPVSINGRKGTLVPKVMAPTMKEWFFSTICVTTPRIKVLHGLVGPPDTRLVARVSILRPCALCVYNRGLDGGEGVGAASDPQSGDPGGCRVRNTYPLTHLLFFFLLPTPVILSNCDLKGWQNLPLPPL